MTENERIDPETGAVMRRDIRSQTVEYRGFRMTVMVSGWFADDSDEGVLTEEGMAVMDEALVLLKARAGSVEPE